MSYSDTKISGLLLTKGGVEFSKEIGLTIYNINDLTDDELKHLVQIFFESIPNYKPTLNYNDITFICSFIFKNKTYKIFLFGEENDFKKMIIKFFNFLKNINIERFDCSPHDLYNDIDIINLVGDIIKNSNIIEHVFFPGSYFENDAFKILYNYMKNHKNLKSFHVDLDFGYSSEEEEEKIPNKCINYIDNIIKSSNIEDLHFLNKEDYHFVFENLLINFFRAKNPNIRYTSKCLNDDLILKLSDMIKKKEIGYLIKINLSFNKITSKGFSILVNSLLESKNENILEIDMGNNKLDDDCVKDLGNLIKQNKKIRVISMNDNYITDKGIEELSEYIVGNTFIKSINLSFNSGITDKSFEVIKYMINSSTVSFFKVHWTNVSEEIKSKIFELSEIPIKKREIPLITNFDVKSASKRMKE